MFTQDKRGDHRRILGVGDDGIYADAWGRQKNVHDFSLFSATFSFPASLRRWIEYIDGVEQATNTNVSISNGELDMYSNGGSTLLMSRRNPKYQGNRGHLYSNSLIIKNATKDNGKMYAVVRTYRDSVVIEERNEVDLSSIDYDPSKGNTYDIQSQLRDVGNSKFFINQKEVYFSDTLGKRDNLILSNMSNPLSFECDNNGNVRFGFFTPQNGIFFEWKFNSTQETEMHSGCVDLSSEGGAAQRQEFVSAIGNEHSATDSVVIAIRIPEDINGVINTIDAELSRIKATVSKKSNLKIWITRDTNALTITNGSWQPIGGGNIEAYTPTSSSDCTFNSTNADIISIMPCQANINNMEDNPAREKIDFYLVHGDYIVVEIEGSAVDTQAFVQLGYEI